MPVASWRCPTNGKTPLCGNSAVQKAKSMSRHIVIRPWIGCWSARAPSNVLWQAVTSKMVIWYSMILPAAAVAHGAMDLVDDAAGLRPLRLLRRDDFARPEPHPEEIEKMDAVLDENAAADLRLPKPVLWAERSVACVVFKERMQRRAEQAGFEDAGDGLVERIVAHDEVHGEKAACRPRGVGHAARVCEGGSERLFAEHMLTCVERGDGEFAVRRGRRRDVDDLHVVARGECVDVRADRQAKFLARLPRSLRDRVGHGGCAQPRDRAKLAQAEAAKRAAPEQSHPELRARCFSFSRCFHGRWNIPEKDCASGRCQGDETFRTQARIALTSNIG